MIWIALVILTVILIPNLYKLFETGTKMMRFTPIYLQSIRADPTILENENTRTRLQNAFKQIFFSMQTHALNAVAILLLCWIIWNRNDSALAQWHKIIISIVSIAACVSNYYIARYLISEYKQVYKGSEALKEMQLELGNDSPKDGILTISDSIHIYAAIGFYFVSSIVSICLLLVLWL